MKEDSSSAMMTNAPIKIPMPVKLIHPSIDFKFKGMILGFKIPIYTKEGIVDSTFYIVRDGNKCSCEENVEQITLNNIPYIINKLFELPSSNEPRWHIPLMEKFINDPKEPPNDFFESIKDTAKRYIYFQKEEHYNLYIIWIIGTYFYPIFQAYPYLFISGTKDSGKSTVMEFGESLALNGQKVTTITQAAMGKNISTQRCTLFLDQTERIDLKLIAILADSYKKTGGKRMVSQGNSTQEFDTFCPKVFGGFKELPYDLADRCIRFNMLKSRKQLNAFMGINDSLREHRHQIYSFLMMKSDEVKDVYESLESDSSRKGELWKPLHAIAQVLGLPKQKIDKLKLIFDECLSQSGQSITFEEEILLRVLYEKANNELKSIFILKTSDITTLMKNYDSDIKAVTPQWLGIRISLFDLAENKRKTGRSKLKSYTFDVNKVKDITFTYLSNVGL
ncbi:MAG: hypothetical protein HQK63_10745 [Desulfamplus sp.]|nr:hypothetical protein [Desulfamplus sp.]